MNIITWFRHHFTPPEPSEAPDAAGGRKAPGLSGSCTAVMKLCRDVQDLLDHGTGQDGAQGTPDELLALGTKPHFAPSYGAGKPHTKGEAICKGGEHTCSRDLAQVTYSNVAGLAVGQGGHQLVTVPSDKAPMRLSGHKTVTGKSTGAAHVGDFIWKAHHSSLITETKKHPTRKEEGRVWDQAPRDE